MTLLDTVRSSDRDGDVAVMVTGVGTLGASGTIKALRQTDAFDATIVGVDENPDAYGFSLVDTAATVPAAESDHFVPELLAIARREEVDVVFPLGDDALRPLADANPRFETEGIEVMVSTPSALSTVRDRGRLYGELAKQGHPATPEFYRVSTYDEFVEAVYALGYPDERVCFKPPVGGERRCLRILDPDVDRFSSLLNRKPSSIVASLDEIQPVLEETDAFPDLVVMEHLPGEEYSVDVLAPSDGEPVAISRSFTETRGGHPLESTVEEVPRLIAYARELSALVGIEHAVTFRFKDSADGSPKLVDVHPRVSRTVTACVGAGANIPALAVRYAVSGEVPTVDVDWGTHVTRDWTDVFYGPDQEPSTI